MRRAILTLVILALCTPLAAAGKVTVDPNVAGAAVQKTEEEVDSADPRLSQKITISESRKLVSAILDDLSKQTGVVFRAGYNSNDWQVRDRRMSIFAKDVPLVQIMNSISHVMKFKWDRKGDPGRGDAASPHASVPGKWQYRLYMDRRTLLGAETQRLREEERQRAKAVEERKQALERYASVGNPSSEDLARLKADDPLQYLYVTTGFAQALGQMFQEVPVLSDAMAGGQEISVNGADMSVQGRAAITGMINGLKTMFARMKPNQSGVIEGLQIDPTTATITLNRMLARQDQNSMQHLLLADVGLKAGNDLNLDLPLMDPESNIGHAIGRVLVKATEGQIKIEDLEKEMGEEIKSAIPKDVESTTKELGEPVIEHPEDPALEVKVKLQPDSMKLADVQKALSDAAGYAVVSDSFGKNSGAFEFVKTESELGALLNKLAHDSFYNWDKKASVIEFRDREWFRRRAMQIPEATIEGWRQTLRDTGTLDLPELAEIARLDPEQYNQNVKEDDFLSKQDLDSVIMFHRDQLRIFASLSDAQRQMIMSDTGPDVRELLPDQRNAVVKLINTHNVNLALKPDTQMILKITSKEKGKQIEYTLAAGMSAGGPPISDTFVTPKYQEPKPDKPADKPKSAEQAKPDKPSK